MFYTVLLSSLEKVLPSTKPVSTFINTPSIFKNESFNFQVAYQGDDPSWHWKGPVTVCVESPLCEQITISTTSLVPSNYPAPPHADADYITSMPSLLPDVLEPLSCNQVKILPHQWRSLWFEVVPSKLSGTFHAGIYPIAIIFKDGKGVEISRQSFDLEIIDALLPKQSLIHTEWFHTDCLANFYQVDVFSEKHWMRIEQFMQTASMHGINMILTPLFTPPLDTEVGGERLTVQLIDVALTGSTYSFNFDKLLRWIEIAKRAGIEYLEMSHLFTQWGALSTPKIMATVEGQLTQIFGWDTSSQDPKYKCFLDQFLPQLTAFLQRCGVQDRCYFHISDEPDLDQLESYQFARDLVGEHLEDYPIIDALSNLEFYQTGALKCPIPSNDHIQPFIDAGVPNLWTYYCCAQSKDVSNRFMALPSFRNRILGLQLFKYELAGFLHWGYNFYNTQFSKKAIDPYKVTDAGCAFPSGDAFLVYPGEDGPIASIRLKVLAEALYDLRALELLTSFTSRAFVVSLLEQDLEAPITFSNYPHSAAYLLDVRQKVNQLIKSYL